MKRPLKITLNKIYDSSQKVETILLVYQKEKIKKLNHLITLSKSLQFGWYVRTSYDTNQYYIIRKTYNNLGLTILKQILKIGDRSSAPYKKILKERNITVKVQNPPSHSDQNILLNLS